jgi:hypothetical protein
VASISHHFTLKKKKGLKLTYAGDSAVGWRLTFLFIMGGGFGIVHIVVDVEAAG